MDVWRPGTAQSVLGNLRNRIETVSGVGRNRSFLFQRIARNEQLNRRTKEQMLPDEERLVRIHSHLPLQMCIYFHMYYSIVFYIFTLALFIAKKRMFIDMVDQRFFIVFIIIFIVSIIIELARVLTGWSGNLSEKVPKTFAFLLFTLLQIALQLYLTIMQPVSIPINIIFGVTQLLLLLLELIFGLIALRRFVHVSGARFSLYFNKDGTLYQPEEENKDRVELQEFEGEDTSSDKQE